MHVKSTQKRLLTAVTGMACALLLSACEGKVQQCHGLIGAINGEAKNIAKMNPVDLEKVRTGADDIEKGAKRITETAVRDEKLRKFQTEYASFLTELAGAGREMSEAVKGKDSKKIKASAKKLASFNAKEQSLVGSINKYCGASGGSVKGGNALSEFVDAGGPASGASGK